MKRIALTIAILIVATTAPAKLATPSQAVIDLVEQETGYKDPMVFGNVQIWFANSVDRTVFRARLADDPELYRLFDMRGNK